MITVFSKFFFLPGFPQRVKNQLTDLRSESINANVKVNVIALPDRQFLSVIGATKHALNRPIDWISKEEFR